MGNQLQLGDLLLFGVPLAFSSAVLAALHWYPWNRGTKPLTRRQAYTIGTLVLMGSPISAMLVSLGLEMRHDEVFWIAHLLATMFVCGSTVNFTYWLDGIRAVSLEDSDAE